MENKFKEKRTTVSTSMWSDWREQLRESELIGLDQRLEKLEREILLDWLQWHNPKGNYTDRKCIENGVRQLSKAKAIEYTYKEILRIHLKRKYNAFSNTHAQLMFNN
ncbi:MAG: hypothetical protein LBF27_19335 [Sphingobacterium sp.]|jgi:hypothetical protein|nr:hypothetical protein [Sphingobacterium sp.]